MDTSREDSGDGISPCTNNTNAPPCSLGEGGTPSSASATSGLLAPSSPSRVRPKRHEKRSGSAQRMDGLLRHSSGLGTLQTSTALASPLATAAPNDSNHLTRPTPAFPSSTKRGSVGSAGTASANNSSNSRHQQPPVSLSPGSPRPSYPHPQLPSTTSNNTYEIDMKVVVLGQGNCGKSSFITKLVHGTFARNRPATIGVDYQSRSFELEFAGLARLQRQYGSSGGNGGGGGPPRVLLKLNLWDIAGQEDCGIGTSTYYQGAKAAIIVYDVTNPASLAKALAWKRDLDKKASFDEGGMFRIPAILVGNKTDLVAYPLPLADSQEVYQRIRRNSLRKSDRGSTASVKGGGGTGGVGLRRPSSSNRVDSGTTRGSTASNVTAPHRGSMASGGHHRSHFQRPSSSIYDDEEDDDYFKIGAEYNDGDDYDGGGGVNRGRRSTASDCGIWRSPSNTSSAVPSSSTVIPHANTRGRTGSRILDAEQAASDALLVGSVDNSPNGFVDVSVVPPPNNQHPTSTHHQDPTTSIDQEGRVLTTPHRGQGGSGGGSAVVRTHSSSRFLAPNPFNASKGYDLDALVDGEGGRVTTETANCVNAGVGTDISPGGGAAAGRTQSGRPRTPTRTTYDNKSRRGSMTALGTPGLKSPNRRADGDDADGAGGGTRSRRQSININLHLDALSPRGNIDAFGTPTSPDPLLPPSNNTTSNIDAVLVTTPSTGDATQPTTLNEHRNQYPPYQVNIGNGTKPGTSTDVNTTQPSSTTVSATPGNNSISGIPGGRNSVAQNLRRSYHNHQLQQAAALEKQHQDSRMTMPETKQQVQDFINEYRFAGHFFSSARSGLSVDEIAEYTLQSILKMDPHGTDDIERELRGERGGGSSSTGGGGGRIGISSGGGKITKASMSASPSRRGGKKRQQTRFGGCQVQ